MKIGVLTSGGDAPGMNAAIRAVTRAALADGASVYGFYRGYEGLLDCDFKELKSSDVGDRLQRGGTFLQTARSMRFMEKEGQLKACENLKTLGIDALVVIGGDGSFNGALCLDELGIKVMCLPGSIDNDLAYTDYTIGFDTAINTVLDAISKIRDTSSSHERCTIIEVMGRNCGDIALFTGLAGGAESILVPEHEYDVNEICKRIIIGRNRGKLHNIIIKAEGIPISSDALAKEIQAKTGVESKVVILSYLQRGGSPTANDRILASRCGAKAYELIKSGSESKAIGCSGLEIVHYPLREALAMKSEFKKEFYDLSILLS